jgi:diacylglycerol kinase family enzyme
MEKKVPVIVNPHSKKNLKLKGSSIDHFKRIGRNFVDVRAIESFEHLDDLARECLDRKVPYIGISGGDGSIHQVLSRFINIYGAHPLPPVVILKDGTMNNIAATIALKGNGHDVLKRFVRRLEWNRPLKIYPRDTMKIGDKYCFLFGTGLTTNILNAVYEGKSKDTPKVIMVMLRAFNEGIIRPNSSALFRRFKARVFLNGEELECNDLLGILAGTVEDIGMGFRVLSCEKTVRGTFRVIATGVKPFTLARNILALKKGRVLDHPLHYDSQVKTLRIVSDTPFDYTMDGDIYFADRELEVEVGPEVKLVSV